MLYMRTLLAVVACGLFLGCLAPGPEIGREMGVDGEASGLELVSSVDPTSAPVTFSGLAGDASDTVGFRLVARLLAGEPGTAFALRINGVDWGYFYWRTVNRDGVLSADTTTPPTGSGPTAPFILLHAGVLDFESALTVVLDVPVSGQSGPGFNQGIDVQWQATVQSLGESLTGSGTTIWTAELDRVDLIAASGSLAESGSRVALYRMLR